VFVRFSAVPVYGSSDLLNSLAPVGVLLFGDIVNGKAGIVDIVEDQFSDFGFTGVAAYNANTNVIHPLSGVYASYNHKQQYSYDVQGDYPAALRESYHHGESEETESKLGSEEIKYYIKRADLSFRLDTNNDEILLPEFYPPVMLIRGTSVSQWDSFKKNNLALSVSVVVVELAFMIGMFAILYRPIHKFAAYMDAQLSYAKPKSLNLIEKVSNAVGGPGSSNNTSIHQNTRTDGP
jgi:hypothetical protein